MRQRPSKETSEDPRMAITLERGLKLLGCFRASDEGPLSNRELAARAGLPKATVSRLTYTLTKLGFLLHSAQYGYSLGPGVLGPAYVFYAGLNIRHVSRPFLRRLATRPGVYLSIGTRQELRIISLESATADWPAPLTGLFNAQAPIERSAAGHAYLAGLPSADRALLIDALRDHHDPKRGEWHIVQAHIERDIQAIADHGYCVVMGEWHESLNAVAVPVRVPARHLYLVLSAGGPAQLLSKGDLNALGVSLCGVAREIERRAGKTDTLQD
jgi:DNA-binding IclR family transcriptional regulator